MSSLAPADGPLARWSSWFMLPAALLCGLVVYMLVGALASVVWTLLSGGSLDAFLSGSGNALAFEPLLGGNAVGLLLGLGVASLFFARMDSSAPKAVLRVASTRPSVLILAVVGLVAFQPIVLWLGHINEALPLPEFIRALEEQQMELIRWIVAGDGNMMLNLMLVAVVPGICEELFFRGYVQHRAERSWGVPLGIAFSGIAFGLFHLRLTEALPLCALGLYMAYLVWCTGSIWVPIAVHFVNNAAALILARMRGEDMLEPTAVPWPWILLGLVILAAVIGLLHLKRPTYHGHNGLD